MQYAKSIEQTDTGMVVAEVFSAKTGKRVALEFFYTWPWRGQVGTPKRAHAWADEWMGNCAKYCQQAGREEGEE